jgi:hypothetical protein
MIPEKTQEWLDADPDSDHFYDRNGYSGDTDPRIRSY